MITSRSRRGRRWTRVGRLLTSEPVILVALCVAVVLITVGAVASEQILPISALVLPLLLGGLWLRPQAYIALMVVVAAALVVIAVALPFNSPRFFAYVVVVITGVLLFSSTRSRARLGVTGLRGETMLVDLRDRLTAQGEVPPLPRAWQVDVAHEPAFRGQFSGDFIVATKAPESDHFELVLVDVSGKGVAAGTRALMLSGAFGGLLGALQPADFFPAANEYLLRRDWGEGFATAVHVALDLRTGAYEVRTAGHPPPVRYRAASGRWTPLETTGGLLGVMPSGAHVAAVGELEPGDALVLFTDGLVEVAGRDMSEGIDRLLGQAERLVTQDGRLTAKRLLRAASRSAEDDQALVLIRRLELGPWSL